MAESNGSNGMVETAVATAAVERKRSVTRDDYAKGGVIHFMVPTYGFWGQGATYSMLPANLPAYNRYAFFTSRDTTLLMTRHHEALWAAALYTAVSTIPLLPFDSAIIKLPSLISRYLFHWRPLRNFAELSYHHPF